MSKKNIYFASDFHLGAPNIKESQKREKKIVEWLNEIEDNAKTIYLVGDIFDFWFEYKKVIPKGFVRLLGKLAQLSDNGITIHLFVGNHDLWMKKYLKEEIGIIVHYKSKIINEQDKKIFIGHGDELGKGDYLYKFLRIIFTSKICQWAFSRLHPNLAFSIAHIWSNKSRNQHSLSKDKNKLLISYCKEQQKFNPVDYYIFGHTHIPLELKINKNATYINLGDWITHKTYAVLEKGKLKLKKFKS